MLSHSNRVEIGIHDHASRVGHADLLQPHLCQPADRLHCSGNDSELVAVVDVVAVDGGKPFSFSQRLGQSRAQYLPNFSHMDAAEGLVWQVGEVDPERSGSGEQGAVVQWFAVNQRPIHVPCNCADAHRAPVTGRSFSRVTSVKCCKFGGGQPPLRLGRRRF